MEFHFLFGSVLAFFLLSLSLFLFRRYDFLQRESEIEWNIMLVIWTLVPLFIEICVQERKKKLNVEITSKSKNGFDICFFLKQTLMNFFYSQN